MERKRQNHKFHRSKLMMRMYCMNLILILAAFLVFLLIIDYHFGYQTRQHNMEYNLSAVMGIEGILKKQEQQLMNMLKKAYGEIYREEKVFDAFSEEEESAELQASVKQFMYRNFNSGSDMTSLLIYNKYHNRVYTITRRFSYNYIGGDPAFAALCARAEDESNRLWLIPSPVYKKLGMAQSYSMIYCIRNTVSFEITGAIELDFETDGITRFLEEYYPGVMGNFLILNEEGEVLYTNRREWYDTDFSEKSFGDGEEVALEDGIYYSNQSETYSPNLRIVGMIAKNEVYRSVQNAAASIFAVMTAVFLVICIVIFFSTNYRAFYLKKIQTAMQKAQNGDLRAFIETDEKYRDELSDIAGSFNIMLTELNRYIDRVYTSELRRRQYQLMALQAQINPHFLYNTFESIRMKAIIDGEEEIADMIYIVSKLFRNSVKGDGITSIRSELENCENYLRLHKMRYQNKLNYQIEMEPDLNECGIVRQALQVMIENYIFHGLDTERDDNRIRIEGRREGKYLKLSVSDNGFGISEEELARIRASFRDAGFQTDGHIGLKNVYQRMTIVFKNDFAMEIDAGSDGGTTVSMRFPAIGEEEMRRGVSGITG